MGQRESCCSWRVVCALCACLTLIIGTFWFFVALNSLNFAPPLLSQSDTHTSAHSAAEPESMADALIMRDKLVVVAHYHEDTKWTQYIEEAGIPVKLIDKEDPGNPDNMDSNNFTEATSYLYYMIKYYDDLPDVVAFVHGHGDSVLLNSSVWTVNEYVAVPHPITRQTTNTRQKEEGGFLVWLGGVENRLPDDPEFTQAQFGDKYHLAFWDLFEWLGLSWEEGGLGLDVPHFVTTLCCSSFSIDRDTLRRVPKDRLQRLFDYLEASPNRDMGVTMEYVWIVLFNQEQWE